MQDKSFVAISPKIMIVAIDRTTNREFSFSYARTFVLERMKKTGSFYSFAVNIGFSLLIYVSVLSGNCNEINLSRTVEKYWIDCILLHCRCERNEVSKSTVI